ncbi:MAG TPA: CDP-diacylglycerol--glycerol-3-phosphate 3-phosphatidyltransferase [Actinobacteria bacterium]|nr:CDP-diacylglycerol--glycerol-3-phosphate 3-phosphatidyltransferase [Actinomycetota bacterium]
MIFTIPNLISAIRISLVPVFLWLLLGREDYIAAGLLIGGVGATDWVDGYLARRLGQVSELGKMLDPIADRLAVAAAVIGGWISGTVPAWFAAALLVREIFVGSAAMYLAVRTGKKIAVRTLGKRATFAIYFAIPAFIVYAGGAHEFFRGFAHAVGIPGLILYWIVAFQYFADIRRALSETGERVSSERRQPGEAP